MTYQNRPESDHLTAWRPLLSRRRLLLGTAGAGTLAALSPMSISPASAAERPARAGLPSAHQVWDWQHQLVEFGTRYTGGPGHARFVDWIADRLARVPGFRVHSDRHMFGRWLARDYSLRIDQPSTAGPSGPVPLAYYYPYSGRTPAHGVTGTLACCPAPDPAPAR